MEEGETSGGANFSGNNFMDLEERQRIIKDRLILVGQNLIDFREKYEEEIMEVKKDLEILKKSVEKIKDFIETISSEFSKFARKDDLEILKKQAKMFQPLEFATKEDLLQLKVSPKDRKVKK
ncbi:hypothetical protein J4411_00420 [Candidatus Pacearchaeota archaeon]|nr:hypothetical protein [uncultured archaeon]MBS3084362.1 hypothetical protein [Candidatus Pacearchaeota archaeon]